MSDELINRVASALDRALAFDVESDVYAGETTHEERKAIAIAIIPIIQAEERARIVTWLHNHDFEDETFNDVSVVLAHAIKRLDHMPDTIEAQETQS